MKKYNISNLLIKQPSQQIASYTNMYSKYKWDIRVISSNIRANKFTPIYKYSPEKTNTHNIECNICYNYFPAINQTNCCFHHICTECIAATVDPNELMCPFCRKPKFMVTPNRTRENLKTDDEDDEAYSKYEKKVKGEFDFDEAKGCSDESISIAMQFNLDVKVVDELLKAGLSQDEILSNLRGKNSHQSIPANDTQTKPNENPPTKPNDNPKTDESDLNQYQDSDVVPIDVQ